MSARREARTSAPKPDAERGEIPLALAVGRCIEVWADPDAPTPSFSTRTRFNSSRAAWLASIGLSDVAPHTVVTDHSPWSAEKNPARLAGFGCTLDDLAALRQGADELWIDAPAHIRERSLTRAYRRGMLPSGAS